MKEGLALEVREDDREEEMLVGAMRKEEHDFKMRNCLEFVVVEEAEFRALISSDPLVTKLAGVYKRS